MQWVPGAPPPPGVKPLERKSDHWYSPSDDVKNAWCCTFLPPYVFMVWCLIKHRDDFAFAFISTAVNLRQPSTHNAELVHTLHVSYIMANVPVLQHGSLKGKGAVGRWGSLRGHTMPVKVRDFEKKLSDIWSEIKCFLSWTEIGI
jgi:hypothetical protein